MRRSEFLEIARAACGIKTVYAKGCLGAIMTESKERSLAKQYSKWYSSHKFEKNRDCVGFDCVCLVKAILWGWTINDMRIDYERGNIEDETIKNFLIKYCIKTDEPQAGDFCTNSDFSHIGIYSGNGKMIDSGYYSADSSGVYPNSVREKNIYSAMKNYWSFQYWENESYFIGDTENICVPILGKGDKNEIVRALQALLNVRGIKDSSGEKLNVDGSFGSKTESAIKKLGNNKANGNIWEALIWGD